MAINKAVGIPINIKNFCYAILDVEAGTYGTPVPIPGLMEISVNVETEESKLSGDGKTRLIVASEGDTTLEAMLNKIPLKDQAAMLGRDFDEVTGVLTRTENDLAAYLATGFEIENEDGTSSFVWLYKGKFQQHSQEYTQKEEGAVTFSTPTITGTFIPDDNGQTGVFADESEATTPIADGVFLSEVYQVIPVP